VKEVLNSFALVSQIFQHLSYFQNLFSQGNYIDRIYDDLSLERFFSIKDNKNFIFYLNGYKTKLGNEDINYQDPLERKRYITFDSLGN
jgi:hypothetical protein